MNVTIERFYQDDCTLGILKYGNFRCFTLELPDLDNQKNISCISAGVYKAKKHISTKNGKVIEIQDVPNRTYIQIHAGNYTRQIQGCILVGDSIKYLDNDLTPDVTNSVNTKNKLLTELPDEFVIEIC
jgi:hypothetical protein